MTDSEDWAKAALDSLKLECLNEIDKDIDKWVPGGDDGNLIPPTEITDVLCDNDCSGRGKCKLGEYGVAKIQYFVHACCH